MANLIGVSAKTVTRWEKGINMPPLDQAVGISHVTGWSIESFANTIEWTCPKGPSHPKGQQVAQLVLPALNAMAVEDKEPAQIIYFPNQTPLDPAA